MFIPTVVVAIALPGAHQPPPWWSLLTGWANLGTALGGIATVVLAVAAIIGGGAGLSDWRAKQKAQKALADEETYNIRLDRQRLMNGWTEGMINVYGVELVTTPEAMSEAKEQLLRGRGSEYVILRVNEGSGSNTTRAHQLRELIGEGHIARPPTRGELDALRRGLTFQHLGGAWRAPTASERTSPPPDVKANNPTWYRKWFSYRRS